MQGMTLRDYQNQIDSINMTLSADSSMGYDQRQALLVERDGLERDTSILRGSILRQEVLGHPV